MSPISVIIPCFNGAATLARALDSCLAQPEATQILVVDDGSSDASASIVRVYALRDARVRLLQMPGNGGPARARNWAALNANAPLIAFLDADDEYLPGALAAAGGHLDAHPREAVIRLDVDYAGFPARLTQHPQFAQFAAVLSNTVPSSLVIRRNVLLALGGFPTDEVFRRHGGEDGALSWTLRDIFGQRRLIDARRVRMHWHAGIHAERFLEIQLGFTDQDPAAVEATLRASRAFLDNASASVQQLRSLEISPGAAAR
ncbi:Glycosyl transferase family A [Paraburkholderia tropica]|uniref:glycosyltransferase family 2 protein n=1 Tax=Paraburkholderia tropica TaxID=92647 RepID=UPI001CB144F9|nr:glycosyltransferase family 2 protein [Paraburkholderia tropica]CAG9235302.1 Glycosyl transferase family A [Paraburkholderia tropica]